MFEFRLREHVIKPERVVIEIWEEEKNMACIYPTETGIKVVSKNLLLNQKKIIEFEAEKMPLTPAILIHLKNK